MRFQKPTKQSESPVVCSAILSELLSLKEKKKNKEADIQKRRTEAENSFSSSKAIHIRLVNIVHGKVSSKINHFYGFQVIFRQLNHRN